MTDRYNPNYRWYILTLGALTHLFVCAMPFICMPVLFSEIAAELGLDLVQIGTIWGTGAVAGIVTSLLGGLISDRYGTKRALSVACLLMATTGALRGLANSFSSLLMAMFFFGFLFSTISLTVHKTAGEWFSGRHLGIANGILSAGMAVGATLSSMISATVLSPLLGSWRYVLFLYGAISAIISLLWFLSRPKSGQTETTGPIATVPLRQALSRVAHIRDVWLIGLVTMFYWGCTHGMTGYLPLYLRDSGWTPSSADGALAAFSAAGMVAAVPLSFLSDRLGTRKAIIILALVISIVGTGLLSIVDGAFVWPLVIMVGIFRDGFMAVLITMVIETDKIGAVYAGTAVGLAYSLGSLGDFLGPPLGNSLADINAGLPFTLWAALAAAALLIFLFVRETSRRKIYP